ncbi:tetratricopeptide repeat protein [Jeotgalibacillus malaysiensis]|uniref:tetratricopeptide repeat protein n=1 Tax=Jeotgalibacillus malaysiensis TaxID=1508404 RepID=UPI00384E8DBA
MMNHTFYLKDKDQSRTALTPTRLAIHVPCTILEAQDEYRHLYHLYFKDQQFLAAKKVSRSRRRSYTEKAFTQGIVFLCPHPLADQLIGPKSTIVNQSFTALLKKIEHDPMQTVEIFSCFDGLIKEEKLFKVLRDHYYSYKRDGKFKKAAIVCDRIRSIYPDHEWIQSIRSEKNDPANDQRTLWEARNLKVGFSIQHQLAAAEEEYRSSPAPGTFKTLLEFTNVHYSPPQQQTLYDRLLADGYDEPARNAFKEYIRNHHPVEAIQLLAQYPFTLRASDVRDLRTLLHDQDNLRSLSFETLCSKLAPLLADYPEEMNDMILAAIKRVPDRDVNTLLHHLTSLTNLPVYELIKQLSETAEDPEQQAAAGELYEKIGFYREAIDCYTYEMELHPESREPVERLSRTYLAAGQAEEAKAYQDLLKTMVS